MLGIINLSTLFLTSQSGTLTALARLQFHIKGFAQYFPFATLMDSIQEFEERLNYTLIKSTLVTRPFLSYTFE